MVSGGDEESRGKLDPAKKDKTARKTDEVGAESRDLLIWTGLVIRYGLWLLCAKMVEGRKEGGVEEKKGGETELGELGGS